MMGLRKWLGLCEHEWTKWEYAEEVWTSHNSATGYEYSYRKQVQTRKCKNCGKTQREELTQ